MFYFICYFYTKSTTSSTTFPSIISFPVQQHLLNFMFYDKSVQGGFGNIYRDCISRYPCVWPNHQQTFTGQSDEYPSRPYHLHQHHQAYYFHSHKTFLPTEKLATSIIPTHKTCFFFFSRNKRNFLLLFEKYQG